MHTKDTGRVNSKILIKVLDILGKIITFLYFLNFFTLNACEYCHQKKQKAERGCKRATGKMKDSSANSFPPDTLRGGGEGVT